MKCFVSIRIVFHISRNYFFNNHLLIRKCQAKIGLTYWAGVVDLKA